MPRFSAKAKELLDQINYYTNIEKAEKLLEELKDPLDIAFGKLFIQLYYMVFQHQIEFLDILTEINNENKILGDKFLQFKINSFYCHYYMGWNNPTVNIEQAEKYLYEIEQSYQDIDFIDDWEKYHCLGWYYYIKAFYEWRIKANLSKALNFQLKCIDAWSKIPIEGEYRSTLGYIMLGRYYFEVGDFEKGIKSQYQALNAFKEYNNLLQYFPLGNLIIINRIKGNLQEAKELNIQHINLGRQNLDTNVIFISLTIRGSLLFQEGNYDEAFEAYQESLTYRMQYNDPLQIFWGYYSIFELYYNRFKITNDKEFLKQAEQKLTDLKDLSKTHPDNKTVVNYANYAQALILKTGNMRKKGKAIDIFEELIEFYPYDIAISLNLLELLFEDYVLSEDQDTINQIDELMEKMGKVPLRNNPEAISSFISQQIFLAKYIYYVKGDISVALNILHNTAEHVKKFKLDNLEQVLDKETQILEKELTKWENADISIKERIKKSEFDKYIQQALKFASQQK